MKRYLFLDNAMKKGITYQKGTERELDEETATDLLSQGKIELIPSGWGDPNEKKVSEDPFTEEDEIRAKEALAKEDEENDANIQALRKKGVIKERDPTAEEHAKQIKSDLAQAIALKLRPEATELIVNTFLKYNHIYTTRDDKKPEIWIYKEGIYIPQGETYIKEFCRLCLNDLFTTHLCNDVINKIMADTYVKQEDFFKTGDVNILAVRNGILNLKEKKLEPFDPNKIFFNKIPVSYDSEKDCPNIKKHFETVLKDKEDVPVMQELLGYLLYRDYKIEKAIMLSGDGGNGKGKTVELMKRFIGAENCSNISLQQIEKDTFAMEHLFNKMANLSADISNTALKETGNFKSLTGHDLISIARKFKTRINTVNFAKMIFCANEIPRTYDTSDAFWRRWVYLEFPYKFVSQAEFHKLELDEIENVKIADTRIIDKLSCPNELSGLLNWALDGLKRLLSNGDFSYSKSANEIKNKWIRKSDSAAAFIMDHIEPTDFEGLIPKIDFKKQYHKYCKTHAVKSCGDKSIKNTLTMMHGVTDDRKSCDGEMKHCWIGIKFKEEKEIHI